MYKIQIIIEEDNGDFEEIIIQLPIIPENKDKVWCETNKHEGKMVVQLNNRCFNLDDDNIFDDISFDGKYT